MGDFPTYSQLFRVGRDEILGNNSKLTRAVMERQGSDANILVGGMTAIGDEVIGQLARVCAAFTLGVSRGRALDKLIFDRFGLLRNAAAPSLGSVQFTTTAANPGSFSIPKGARLQTSDGVQFLTTTSATFPTASTGPISVNVRSTSAGIDQQAAIGAIVNLVSTITGAPADLAVTNAAATAGAADEESDDHYTDRARLFFTTVRRGTVGAIEEQALRYAGVVKAKAFEILDSMGRPSKQVDLYVADQYTDSLARLATVPPSYDTQSQALADAVFLSLEDTRAAGIYVSVTVAQVILQSVILTLSYEAGVDVDAVTLNARGTIVAAVNFLSPGETLTVAYLVDKLRDVRGLVVSGDEIYSPTGSIVPGNLEVLRTTMGLVSAVALTN